MKMMTKVVFTFCGLFIVGAPVLAQHTAPDSTDTAAWRPSLIAIVAGSQVGFQNWAEGGVNTLGLNLGLDGKLEKTTARWTQTHEVRLGYGFVKQDTLDVRKAEDIIRIASAFEFTGGVFFGELNPTFAFQFRSQFSPGYNYKKNPLNDGRTPPVRVSDLMSPGTFQQSIGLTYTPNNWLKQRIGVGAKETVVLIEKLRVLYGVDPDKQARYEVGLESYSEFDREIASNVHYKSTLGLFAAFNQLESPDLLWENFVIMKVNSWLSVNFEWVVFYDTDVSSKTQFKEIFSVGVSYILL